jgi:hypothetical protein
MLFCIHVASLYDEHSPQRLAYVYKAKTERQGSKVRVIWGCVPSRLPYSMILTMDSFYLSLDVSLAHTAAPALSRQSSGPTSLRTRSARASAW